jgi:hypothetical protein
MLTISAIVHSLMAPISSVLIVNAARQSSRHRANQGSNSPVISAPKSKRTRGCLKNSIKLAIEKMLSLEGNELLGFIVTPIMGEDKVAA